MRSPFSYRTLSRSSVQEASAFAGARHLLAVTEFAARVAPADLVAVVVRHSRSRQPDVSAHRHELLGSVAQAAPFNIEPMIFDCVSEMHARTCTCTVLVFRIESYPAGTRTVGSQGRSANTSCESRHTLRWKHTGRNDKVFERPSPPHLKPDPLRGRQTNVNSKNSKRILPG